MELDEMKMLWNSMSEELENQKKLSAKLIIDMTRQKYSNRLGKISFYETLGAIVCFSMAAWLLINFHKLDNWYMITCGSVTLVTLILLPVSSLTTLQKMKNLDVGNMTYKETLLKFTRYRERFLLVQRLGIFLAVGLVITSLPVASMIMKGKDIFAENSNVLFFYIPAMLVFLLVFGRYGYTHYARITKSAEQILSELQDEDAA